MLGTYVGTRFRMLAVLRSRAFALLWIGQTISALGDSIYRITLAFEVYFLTHSATMMGLVLFANLLPVVVLTLVGGAFADRLPRHLILLSSDSGRALVVLLVALLTWLHVLTVWHVLVLSLLFGVAESFFIPSYRALRPQLVSPNDYQSANALTGLGTTLTGLLGPLIGAVCILISGATGGFALDGITFLVSIMSLVMLHRVLPTRQPLKQETLQIETHEEEGAKSEDSSGLHGFFSEIVDGLRYVGSIQWLWISVLIASVGNVLYFGAITIALPKLIYGSLGANAWLYGLIIAANATGDVIAALIIGQMTICKRGLWAYLAQGGTALGLFLLGLLPLLRLLPFAPYLIPLLAIGAMLIAGFGLGVFLIIWETLLQHHIPEEYMGRVASVDQVGSDFLLPIGLLVLGFATDHFGASSLFLLAGTLSGFMVLVALCFRQIRQLS